MKSAIKVLSLSVFIAAPVLCMDPSSLLLSEVRPQEVSSYAGQDAERKQTQAELDRQQFLSEKDAKERAAQINGASQAATTLQSEAAKTDELIKAMQNRLPNQVFRMIGRFVPDYKIVHQNMEKLIPAIIEREKSNIFDLITATHYKLAGMNSCHINGTESPYEESRFEFVFPSQTAYAANDPNAFAAYKFQNKQIIFKVCRNKREELERLTIDQIKYLMMLYDLRKRKADGNYITRRTYFREHDLKPTQRDLELYTALPEQIKNCLKHNYGQNMPQQMKYPAGTIVF